MTRCLPLSALCVRFAVGQAISAWLPVDMEPLNVPMDPLCMLAPKMLVLSCMLMVQMKQHTLQQLLSA